MAMPLGFASKVSLYSMRKRSIRTVLSLLPCILLIALMFVGATIPNGLVNELDRKVLQVAQDRQAYLHLDSYLFSQTSFSSGGSMDEWDVSFNEEAYRLATESPYVDEVYPQRGSIGGEIKKIGTVEKAAVQFSGTSPEYARLYTPEPFVYREGEPIPILINPIAISGMRYNWDGKSTLELDYSDPKQLEQVMKYDQLKATDSLVGTTFEATFAPFPNLPEAFDESSFSGFGPSKTKLRKLTDQDRDILQRRIREIYAPYWNVDALSVPINRTFKIVGVLDGRGSTAAYIPNDAVPALWNAVYQRQVGARTTKQLDKETLANEPNKMLVRDGFIQDGNSMSGGIATWQKEASVSAWQVDLSSVSVPGLLLETTKNARGQNEYRTFMTDSITAANFRENGAIVKLVSAEDRATYVNFLNENGLFYYDNSPLTVIKGIRKGANIFVTWLTIILGTIVAFILLTTMSRFVADSRKEIGVWRAIGATRSDIITLVLVRMGWLLLIGIAIGIAIGYGVAAFLANIIVSNVNAVAGDFNPYSSTNIIGQIIVGMMGGQVPTLELTALLSPNWSLLLSRLGILALITLCIGLLPALRAARISPVTAIRDAD